MPQSFIEKLLEIYESEKDKKAYVPFSNLPPLLVQSLILVEDHRFFRHSGVDVFAICRAFLTNVMNLRIIEGGSTITQQLVRGLVLSKGKTLRRKFKEIALAMEIEKKLSKRTIIEFYLNTCYFLSIDKTDALGIARASEALFGKKHQELSLAEASFLAALIGRPLTNNSPETYVMRTIYRQHLIMRYLKKSGKISRSDFDMAINENIRIFGKLKNDFPIEKVGNYTPKYIRPYYFLKPVILAVMFLKRCVRFAVIALKYYPIIYFISRKHRLPFSLIRTVIENESSFIGHAISTKNAKGLMQVIDLTFEYVSRKYKKNWVLSDIFKPAINIETGALYLKEMIGYFRPKVREGYSLHYALAAYNAGPHNIDKVIDLIDQKKLPRDWHNLKEHLPLFTRRYALYTIKYVESVTRKLKWPN